MDRVLKPNRFDTEPDDATASKQWNHWIKTFENFLNTLNTSQTSLDDGTKLSILINYVAPSIYEYISECQTYACAVKTLKDLYIKPKSEVFSRHMLQTRKQQAGESLDQYIQW